MQAKSPWSQSGRPNHCKVGPYVRYATWLKLLGDFLSLGGGFCPKRCLDTLWELGREAITREHSGWRYGPCRLLVNDDDDDVHSTEIVIPNTVRCSLALRLSSAPSFPQVRTPASRPLTPVIIDKHDSRELHFEHQKNRRNSLRYRSETTITYINSHPKAVKCKLYKATVLEYWFCRSERQTVDNDYI